MKAVTTGKHSCYKALDMGYEKTPDINAYSGAYYIKDGKKWIFNIIGLKKDLGVTSDDDLRQENYDVDVYWMIEKDPVNSGMIALYEDLTVESGASAYLEGGMYLHPDGSID